MPIHRGKLKPEDEAKIQRCNDDLLRDLNGDFLANALLKERVFTFSDKDEILTQNTRENKVEHFLLKLRDSGPQRAYDVFLDVLKNSYPHLAKKLEETSQDDGASNAEGTTPRTIQNIESSTSRTRGNGQEDGASNAEGTTLQTNQNTEAVTSRTNDNGQNNDVHLILIGKTGSGARAVGNSIVKQKVFKTSSALVSLTTSRAFKTCRSMYKGRQINVTDMSSIEMVILDIAESIQLFCQALNQAISEYPNGFHCFLLTLQYRDRLRSEDMNTIQMYRNILGESFIRKFCIVVMTCGDSFEAEHEDTGETFHEWRESQKGGLGALFLECENRVVLFDNTTRDEGKKNAQLDRLLDTIDKRMVPGHCYTEYHLKKAEGSRKRLFVELKLPQLEHEFKKLLNKELKVIEKMKKKEAENAFEIVLYRIKEFQHYVMSEDQETGALVDFNKRIERKRLDIEKKRLEMKGLLTE